MVYTRLSCWVCWCLVMVASPGLASETDFSLLVRVQRNLELGPDTRHSFLGARTVYANHYSFRVSNITPQVEYLHLIQTNSSFSSPPSNIAARSGFVVDSDNAKLTITGFAWYFDTVTLTYYKEDFSRVLNLANAPTVGQGGEFVIELYDPGTISHSVTANANATTQPSTQPFLEAENVMDEGDITAEAQEAISPGITGATPSLGTAIATLITEAGLVVILETDVIDGLGPAEVINQISTNHADVVTFFNNLGTVWAAIKAIFAAAAYLLTGWVAFRWIFQAIGVQGEGPQ